MASSRSKVSELRVILLGKDVVESSSVGNLVLGRSAFETEVPPPSVEQQSERARGQVEGRYITLINTPHLLHHLTLEQITLRLKECVSLAAPGPHALLLLIQPESFTQEERSSMMTVLHSFSKKALDYCMVLTTQGYTPSLDPGDESCPLHKLMLDCSKRHFSFESGSTNTALIEKIEQMVQQNGGHMICEEESQSVQIQQCPAGEHVCERLNVVVCGCDGAVKASISDLLVGQRERRTESSSVCVRREAEVSGHLLTLVEMPALYNTHLSEEQVMQQTLHCVSLCPPGVHAFLFIVAEGRLTDEDKAEMEIIQRIFSSRVLQHTIVLLSQEDVELDQAVRSISESCKGGHYHFGSDSSVSELMEKIKKLLVENHGGVYTTLLNLEAQVEIQKYANGTEGNIHTLQNVRSQSEECAETEKLTATKSGKANTNIAHYNLILSGPKGAGASSTGNTILGRDDFSVNITQQPVSHDIQKEMVTISRADFNVFDVPGLHEEGMNTEELLKKVQVLNELDESLPTVILLVLKPEISTGERKDHFENIVKQFNRLQSKYKKTAEFMEALPNWIRQNTWLLFTRGDELEREGITAEEIINQNEELKRLVEKLHNRYHVFNNKSSKSSDQVIQLVKKIQEAPLQMPPKIKHFPRTLCPVSEQNPGDRRIVLLGKTGAGKSATANIILGKKRFKSELNPSSVTTKSEMEQGLVAGKKVSIVDTPGLFDTSMSAEDLGVEIGRSVYLSSPGPHAFLFVLQINLRFTEQEEDVVHKFEMMFGEEMRKYTIVLFTQGDQLEGMSADTLIKMNSSLCKLVEKCGGGYHVFNNKDLSYREQVTQLMEKIDRMVEKNGGSCYCNQMFQDAARFKQEEDERRRMEEEARKQKEEQQKQEETERKSKEVEEKMKTEKEMEMKMMKERKLKEEQQEQEETERKSKGVEEKMKTEKEMEMKMTKEGKLKEQQKQKETEKKRKEVEEKMKKEMEMKMMKERKLKEQKQKETERKRKEVEEKMKKEKEMEMKMMERKQREKQFRQVETTIIRRRTNEDARPQNVVSAQTNQSVYNYAQSPQIQVDSGFKKFSQNYGSHLAAAGEVGAGSKVGIGAEAGVGAGAGAFIGGFVGISLGPIGIVGGALLGAHIGAAVGVVAAGTKKLIK